ncbi:MAG: alpha/beta fold hydrolase [Rhodospirillales bacterium]|nr:alpha/beta fold hydrolase [Rhodospirillales bacterium]
MILHAIEAGPRDGAALPLVLLHGLFGAARNFGAVQRMLAAGPPGRHVLALDLRNHGGSPHDPAMTYPGMAADVRATLDAMGLGRVALLGHSMGGKVAMHLACAAPERIARLIVADIAPIAYPPRNRRFAEALLALPLPQGLTRAAADAALAGSIADAGLRGFLLQNLALTPAPHWRIGLAEITAALPAIEGWQAPEGPPYSGPALVLRGARSDYVPDEARTACRALLPAVRFAALKSAGHWLHADDPAGFVASVAAFLQADL